MYDSKLFSLVSIEKQTNKQNNTAGTAETFLNKFCLFSEYQTFFDITPITSLLL